MIYDRQKLEAAGFRVDDVMGGVMIATPQMQTPQFVPVVDGRLDLQVQRSAFHREIAEALSGRLS